MTDETPRTPEVLLSSGRSGSELATWPLEIPAAEAPSEESGLLGEYLGILWSRLGMILLVTVLFAAVALGVSALLTPRYVANAVLEVQDYNRQFLNRQDIEPTAPAEARVVDTYLQTQAGLLKSDAMLLRVLQQLQLIDNPEYLDGSRTEIEKAIRKYGWGPWLDSLDRPGRPSWVRRVLNILPAGEMSHEERALSVARLSLKVTTSTYDRLVNLSYTATDPHLSAEFLNTLMAEYVDYNRELRLHPIEETTRDLELQLGSLKGELDAAETRLQNYAQENGLMYARESESFVEDGLRQVQQEVLTAHADRAAKEARYAVASKSSREALPEVAGNTTLQEFQTKIMNLRAKRAEALTTMLPEHYRIQEMDAELAEVMEAADRERAKVLQRIENEYKTAKQREELLGSLYASKSSEVSASALKAVRYDILRHDVDSIRLAYSSLLQKVKSAEIAAVVHPSNINIVDSARAPLLPAKPNLLVNTGVGGGGGLAFASVLAFVLERRNRLRRKLRSPGEAARVLRLPELGVIPTGRAARFEPGENLTFQVKLWPARLIVRRKPKRIRPVSKDGSPRPEALAAALEAWTKPSAPIAESYRATLASLFLRDDEKAPQVITVASAQSGEGKSTAIANLALAMVETGKKVLIVDGDLRRPVLHTFFGMENGIGLAELLSAESEDSTWPWPDAPRKTPVKRLSIVTGGQLGQTAPAILLFSPAFQRCVEKWRTEYDAILIDTPPLVQFPDARYIGRVSDGVALVVRSSTNSPELMMSLCRRLAQDRIRVLGTILNDWNAPKSSETAPQYYV